MMWSLMKALLALTVLILSTNCVPLHEDKPTTTMSLQTDYLDDDIIRIKQLFKSRAPLINSINRLNASIEAKRRLVKQYREKLQELNELDMEKSEVIHERNYLSITGYPEENKKGRYQFAVNIKQPNDHRREIKVESAVVKFQRKNVKLKEIELSEAEGSRKNIGYNRVLVVYQLLPDEMRRMVTSTVISLAKSGPFSIDITEIVQNWIDEPSLNLGIEVECLDCNISQLISSDHSSYSLNIYNYERTINTARRSKRNSEEICDPGKCCRNSVNITLAEIGHHIEGIHEEGEYITAYTCSGRCPRNYKLHNKWASIKNTLRENGGYSHLKNTCAPTAYEKSYTLFNFDIETGSLSFTEYDDLIVSQCGCV